MKINSLQGQHKSRDLVRGEITRVWICTEEGFGLFQEKDAGEEGG